MALKKKPVTGMKDILPKEMEVRNYVTGLIRETYGSFGFTSIETPGVPSNFWLRPHCHNRQRKDEEL